ncbi:MAG TPA: peptide ABC transporter substrate-binding protein [Pyrinomonadaceae bacterium]|jgi:ABC-type transport system substrate-binding protein|nr:peptide ABC transporter substrate-binding protein [Pyrinomonadaceae bacterium]
MTITRREILRLAGLAVAGNALAACKTGPVVEQENASIPLAAQPFVTPQGRQLPPDAAPLEKQILYEPASEPRHLDISRDIYGAGVAINWGGEPLLRRDQNQQLVPALAESYTAGPHAEYFDFVIRKDARWSDGVPITAHDWVFTFHHLADPALDNPWTWFFYDIKGVRDLKEGKGAREGVGVEALDERTLRIHGEGGPVPHLPALLAYQAAVPAPRHKAEANPEHWADTAENFVSSGPLRLLNWQHDHRLVWDANPFYNGPYRPGIQHLVQLLGAPATGWFNAWLNREIDYIAILQPQEVAQVNADPALKQQLHSFNNFQTEYLALDATRPPLDNLKLRQALSHAVDREAFCTQVMIGTRLPAYSMLPPNFPAYNPDLKSVQGFDAARASVLLSEAGYPGGLDAGGNQLALDLFSNGRDVSLEYVKDQWERHLGIRVNLQILEGTVWGERRAQRAMPIYKGQYEYDFLDPANMLTHLWRSTGVGGSPRHSWKNPKFDELVTQAGREIDEPQRMALYGQAERLLVEDVGAVFLTHMVTHQVWWPYLTGIAPDTSGNTVFRYLDISRFQMYIRSDVDRWRKPR